METERTNTWRRVLQTTARRLLDARPPWLLRKGEPGEPADSPELIAEAFRTLGTSLRIHASGGLRTLLVTSPAPGEGKSLTAANLAFSLAKSGRSVLLVDADLRRPVVHKIFQLPNDLGLSEVLAQETELERAIRRTPEGLHVLPSGKLPDDPTLLLGSGPMQELIRRLSQNFEITLFDAPPVLSAMDAVLLAPLLDWTLLVLRAGITVVEEAKRARTMLEKANGKVLGSVLNSLDSQTASGYHKYANYYTHSKRTIPSEN